MKNKKSKLENKIYDVIFLIQAQRSITPSYNQPGIRPQLNHKYFLQCLHWKWGRTRYIFKIFIFQMFCFHWFLFVFEIREPPNFFENCFKSVKTIFTKLKNPKTRSSSTTTNPWTSTPNSQPPPTPQHQKSTTEYLLRGNCSWSILITVLVISCITCRIQSIIREF